MGVGAGARRRLHNRRVPPQRAIEPLPTAALRAPATAGPGRAGRRAVLAALAAVLGPLALLLAGCAAPGIDTRYSALGQDSRVQYLILHYTDEPLERSLQILTQQPVSAHYLLSDGAPPVVYRLVDEQRRAWHAGQSYWQGATLLNAASIGIEIVHVGQQTAADGTRSFTPYPPAQIEALVRLARDIVARHQIRPDRILGHSDIAPQRKRDPGPAFPWQALAEAGLIAWPDAARVAVQRARFEAALPDVAWFQRALAAIGYQVGTGGELDAPTRRVLAAFQMRWRPARFDGEPDAETAALLQVVGDLPAAADPR
jgi:N-acetylmuramoyl-L-alanine amidase